MKKGISILVLLLCCQLTSVAQLSLSKKDSLLTAKLDSLNIHRFDALITPKGLDTLSFVELNKIDSIITKTNQKIDSLQSLKLPTAKYERKLDSLQGRLQQKFKFNQTDSINSSLAGKLKSIQGSGDSVQLSISKKIESLQQKINQKLSFRDSVSMGSNPLGLQADNPLMDIKTQLPFSMPASPGLKNATIPSSSSLDINLPKTEIPKSGLTGELDQLNGKVNNLQQLPKDKVNELDISKDIDRFKGQVAKVGEITSKADQYKEEIKEIGSGNLEKVEELPKELENAAMQVGEVKEFSEGQQKFAATKNMLQQYQDMVSNAKDTKELESKVKEAAKEQLPDYFAGQEDKLKAGVAQLDKLKKKYKTIPDSRYLPKHVPNEMKGKPFRDRIIPGIGLQFFKSDKAAIDFAPYFSYKLSGRFRPGIGASWRTAISVKDPSIRYDEVHGFRIFNDLRWRGNFYLHTEGEWLRYSPEAILRYKFPADEDRGLWQFRLNAGLFRTYRISNRFNGQAQFLYNVLDMKHFPQTKNTSIRIGFEYKIKEKKK